MVTVKIPDNSHPWRCNINGVEYVYAAGTTQSVPEAVANLIHEIETAQPQPAPVDPPIPMPEPPAPELPSYAAGDAGKVLSVNDDGDGVEWAEAGGGGGVLIATDTSGTLDVLSETLATAMQTGLAAIKVGGIVKPIVAYDYDDVEYTHHFYVISWINDVKVAYRSYSAGDGSYPQYDG